MSLLIAILIVVVVAAIPGIAIGTAIRRVLDKRKPSPPRRIDRSCPYCGGVAFRFVDAGEPAPHHFVCPECRREFGDIAQMTPAEAASVKRINEDCARVDALPNLQQIKQAVLECTRSGQSGTFVTFTENGKIVYDTQIIGTFQGVKTQAGRLRLAWLCGQYCKDYYSYGSFNCWLMDSGLAWDHL